MAGVPLPGPGRAPYRSVLSPRPGRPLSCVLLDNEPYGVMCHWVELLGRSMPCVGRCDFCKSGLKARWVGYWSAALSGQFLSHSKGELFILESSTRTARQILDFDQSVKRGLGLVLRRGREPRSKVTVEFHLPPSGLVVPSMFNVRAVLEHIWGRTIERLQDERFDIPPAPPWEEDHE